MTLRDAVRTATNSISKEGQHWAASSKDPATPTAERVAAFGKLIASEIGQTWLRRSRGVQRDFDRTGIYLKFEGDNPSGTQKDRIAFAHVLEALEVGATTVALATCGNYGVAVALAASLAGIDCHIFVPAGYHTKRLVEMEALGARIFRPPGSYEETVEHSRASAAANGWYDANPGGRNASLQLLAYSYIADEIVADLGRLPDVVAVPVSNGTLLAGIAQGFGRIAGDRTPPRMVAASSTGKNPIVTSFLSGSRSCIDLDPARVRETHTNEPLINWHSFDGQEALDALYATGGGAAHVSDDKLRRMSAYLSQKEALQVLPAATAGLISLVERPAADREIQVAVLTAKR